MIKKEFMSDDKKRTVLLEKRLKRLENLIEEEMRSRRVRNESKNNNRTRKDLDDTFDDTDY